MEFSSQATEQNKPWCPPPLKDSREPNVGDTGLAFRCANKLGSLWYCAGS